MPEIRDKIAAAIAASGRTITDVAAAAGMDRSDLSRWLHGGRESIGVRKIEALMRELGLEVRATKGGRRGGCKMTTGHWIVEASRPDPLELRLECEDWLEAHLDVADMPVTETDIAVWALRRWMEAEGINPACTGLDGLGICWQPANGWYVAYPEGGGWIACQIVGGQVCRELEQSQAATMIAAGPSDRERVARRVAEANAKGIDPGRELCHSEAVAVLSIMLGGEEFDAAQYHVYLSSLAG